MHGHLFSVVLTEGTLREVVVAATVGAVGALGAVGAVDGAVDAVATETITYN